MCPKRSWHWWDPLSANFGGAAWARRGSLSLSPSPSLSIDFPLRPHSAFTLKKSIDDIYGNTSRCSRPQWWSFQGGRRRENDDVARVAYGNAKAIRDKRHTKLSRLKGGKKQASVKCRGYAWLADALCWKGWRFYQKTSISRKKGLLSLLYLPLS